MNTIKLKIADVIIQMRSRFFMEPLKKKDSFRYQHFFYRGKRNADISLEIFPTRTLPTINKDTKRIFLTRHPESNEINWALFKNKKYYILREYGRGRVQHFSLSNDFRKAKAYLLKRKGQELSWNMEEIIYDALQIILIHYLSRRGGIFAHAVGVKDKDSSGFLFLGKSGQGKTTTARLWHSHSQAKVLNDDRVIVRKVKNEFFIYGSPWHGDFSDYLASRVERAKLKAMFFIFHSKKNQVFACKKRGSFFIYPYLFPPFWDREGLNKVIFICDELMRSVSCFRFGFRKTRETISFTRNTVKEMQSVQDNNK